MRAVTFVLGTEYDSSFSNGGQHTVGAYKYLLNVLRELKTDKLMSYIK